MRKFFWISTLFLVLSMSSAAQDNPRAEVFGGYSFVRANFVGTGFNFNGASGSIAFNPGHWWGIVADGGFYRNTNFGVTTNLVTYLFGPKFAYHGTGRITPFAQALFGGAHANESFIGITATENAFTMAVGGGIDIRATHHFAFRAVQAEYLMTKFTDGSNNRQNNARVSIGIVYRIGGTSAANKQTFP
jgi:hypothetical protein